MPSKRDYRLFTGIQSIMILLLFLIVFILPVSAFAQYNYTTNNGLVTITKYTGSGGDVTIPDKIIDLPVTYIGDLAFYCCTTVNSVTIPDSVINIGAGVFEGCASLSSIMIGTNVANIGASAFIGCPISNVLIPDSVTNIGLSAFRNCINLTGIIIGSGVVSIENRAFENSHLNSVTIPDSVTSIGDDAFATSRLMSVAIGTNVTRIGNNAFYGCSGLTTVVIPSSVTIIGGYAFYSCSGLTNVSIGNQVALIGGFAFYDCYKLPRITFPNSVTNIGPSAFYHCTALSCVMFGNSLASIASQAFQNCGSLTSVAIPSSVVFMGDLAFGDCDYLTNLYFNGNAPIIGGPSRMRGQVFYYPWTLGWTATFDGIPTQVNPAYTQWLLDHSFATNRTEDSTDYDNDGMKNWQEYLAHTDPITNIDLLAIISMGSESNSSQISWSAKSNVSYQVMKSSDLMVAWSNAPSGIGGNQQSYQTAPVDGLLQYADPNVAEMTNAFYRVMVVQ